MSYASIRLTFRHPPHPALRRCAQARRASPSGSLRSGTAGLNYSASLIGELRHAPHWNFCLFPPSPRKSGEQGEAGKNGCGIFRTKVPCPCGAAGAANVLYTLNQDAAGKRKDSSIPKVFWLPLSPITSRCRNYLLRTGAAAFLIRATARVASAWFSKPNMAAYRRPTTCAITKLRLIPASPSACAGAWPSPWRLSPWTSRAGDR
jgi:hypothetical protein